MRAELVVPKRNVVRWTPEELDDLSRMVYKRLLKNPAESPIEALNGVQRGNWPEDRRRLIRQLKDCQPILDRIKLIEHEVRQDAHKAEETIKHLNRQIETLRETVQNFEAMKEELDTLKRNPPVREVKVEVELSEDEICRRYTALCLDYCETSELIARVKIEDFFARHSIEDLFLMLGAHLGKTIKREGLPRVAMVGFSANQFCNIRDTKGHLADFVGVPIHNFSAAMPAAEAVDYCLLWKGPTPEPQAAVVSEHFPPEKVMILTGNFSDMQTHIDGLFA